MINCPSCGARNTQFTNGCTQCDFTPYRIDGFLAWAPDLARQNDGFPEASFQLLSSAEQGNFWFRARNLIILWALAKYFPRFSSLLEVGCGTGFVLAAIHKAFPNTKIAGTEIYTAGLTFASKRLPNTELIQMDARSLPYEDEFDIVAAFDVIEHIEEDEVVLRNLHKAIKPGGGCLITVPQHKWLWSDVDELACHKRRYSVLEIHTKVEAAGFQVLRSTSFVSILMPLMYASRMLTRRPNQDAMNELVINPHLDRFLGFIMKVEHYMIRCGLSLPFGGSRLLVLKVKD